MLINEKLQSRALNTLRFLSADAVQQANSGHPGLPMGAAAMGYTIWMRHLRFNPHNPRWVNRDRFVLSGGHGSMLLYSLLHLTGYDLPKEEILNFRQWGSLTPGHPEAHLTPGVEVTTGPLGQGLANGVGMAIAEAHLAARFNRPGHQIIDHYTYAIVTDGDLMEGVASEVTSLAGHLRLGKLIYLYDDNHISIDGDTSLTFTENRAARFDSYGWHTIIVEDGQDVEAVDQAIREAKEDPRPSLILCRTIIGFGLPTRQNTAKAHGEAPGDEELDAAKRNLGWPVKPRFLIPGDVLEHFREAMDRGAQLESLWEERFTAYQETHPDLAGELVRVLSAQFPERWDVGLPVFEADKKGIATRKASGIVLNALASRLPELIGGSADLTGSNQTYIQGAPAFQRDSLDGRNIHFGVREHGMGAIINGMARHGGLIPYGGTFLVFSDYMRPAIRLSALSGYPSIWIYTHESFGLGEDGPTHQPIEHLASLRAMPNLVVIRPADANEVREAWKVAVARRNGPVALLLTRQNVPILDRTIFTPASGLKRGAYVLADLGEGEPELILMASGSEVSLIVEAGFDLMTEVVNVRLISFPSWELFATQDTAYQESVLPPHVTSRLAVEAGVSQGWERWIGDRGMMISQNTYGASAPANVLFEKFGFTAQKIVENALKLLQDLRGNDLMGTP